MPCNGVSVASLSLENDNKQFLDLYKKEELVSIVQNFLEKKNIRVKASPSGLITLPDSNINIDLRYAYNIVSNRYNRLDEALEKEITDLLNGLAGLKRQQVVIEKLKGLGVNVTSQQTAKNGSIVLTGEL